MGINFSEVLKELIKEKGITQTALAKELGLKPNVISMYCSGSSNPEFKTLIKIAEFFDVSLDYLVTGERVENQTVREELGLSESAVENLKEIAPQNHEGKYPGLSSYVNDLLSDKNFFEVLYNAKKGFEEMATYYPLAESAIKEKYGACNFDTLMAVIEYQAAMKTLPYFLEFFKQENIIRGINDKDEYKRLVMKNIDKANSRNITTE